MILCLLALCATVVAALGGEQSTCIVSQVVDAEKGTAIAGAVVLIDGFKDYTDADGQCRIEGLAKGTYTIRIFKGGYLPSDAVSVEITSREAQVNVHLKARQAAEKLYEMEPVDVTAEVVPSTAGVVCLLK